MRKISFFFIIGLVAVCVSACGIFQPYKAPDGTTRIELTPEAEYAVEKTLENAAENGGLLGWIATAGLGVFNLYQYRRNRRKGKTASVAVAGTSLILDAIKARAEKQEVPPTHDELLSILKAYQEQEKARDDIRKELAKQKPVSSVVKDYLTTAPKKNACAGTEKP